MAGRRRKVGHPMALVVLALAAERPMHPYEMARLIRERHKERSIEIKWGSLYTVVGSLERHGYLEATGTERSGRRPERTVYRITEAGQVEMRDWLRELLGRPGKEYRGYEAGLSLLVGVPPEEAMTLLERREAELVNRIGELRAGLAATADRVPRLFLVEAEYELAMMEAEAEWTRGLRRDLVEGDLTGLAQWRELHETGEMPEEWRELSGAGGSVVAGGGAVDQPNPAPTRGRRERGEHGQVE